MNSIDLNNLLMPVVDLEWDPAAIGALWNPTISEVCIVACVVDPCLLFVHLCS